MPHLASNRWWIVSLLILLVLAGWWAVDVRGRSKMKPDKPRVHRTDLTVFTGAGAAFVDGDDATQPYATPNFRGWHYNYPPLLAIALSPLARLHPQVASGVWFALSVACGFGCWFESRRLVRGLWSLPGEAPGFIAVFAVLAMILPALNTLQRGQLGLLLTWLTLLALRLLFTRSSGSLNVGFQGGFRALFGAVLLALAAVIKVFPALPLAMLALLAVAFAPRKRAAAILLGAVGGLLIFLVLLPGAVVGPGDNAAHLRTWWEQVVMNPRLAIDTDFNLRSERNQSLENAAMLAGASLGWIDTPLPRRAMTLDPGWLGLRCVLGLGLVLTCLSLGRTRRPLAVASALALGCSATLVLSPLSWGHYFVMQLPAMVLLPMWLLERGRRRWAWVISGGACGLLLVHYLALPWAGRWGVLGLGTAAWWMMAQAACGLGAISPPSNRNDGEAGPEAGFEAEGPDASTQTIRTFARGLAQDRLPPAIVSA